VAFAPKFLLWLVSIIFLLMMGAILVIGQLPFSFFVNESAELFCVLNGTSNDTCVNGSTLVFNSSGILVSVGDGVGLSNSGNLTAVVLDINNGTGLTISADVLEIDGSVCTVSNGLCASSSVTADNITLNISAGVLSVNQSFNFSWGGNHQFNNYLDIFNVTEPPVPPSGYARMYAFQDKGNTRVQYNLPDGSIIIPTQDTIIIARNAEGTTINKGQVVYVSSVTGSTPQVRLARSDSQATMPAIGLVFETSIGNNQFGRVMIAGILTKTNTSYFAEGDKVYVNRTDAGFLQGEQTIHPYPSQRIGLVLSSHANNGELLVGQFVDRRDALGNYYDNFTIGTGLAGTTTLTLQNANAGRLIWNDTTLNISGNLYVDNTGNVGIGAPTPAFQLQINKTDNTATGLQVTNLDTGNNALAMVRVTGSDGNVNFYSTGAGYTAGGILPHFNDSGVLFAGLGLSGGLIIASQTAASPIRFYAGGLGSAQERMRISTNVGINNTSPTSSLHILGSLNVSGPVLFPSYLCTASEVLTTTSNGTLKCVTDQTSAGGGGIQNVQSLNNGIFVINGTTSTFELNPGYLNDTHTHNQINLTGNTSQQCGGTDKVRNVTLTNGVITIVCDTDQTGGGSTITPEATYTMISTGRLVANDVTIMDLYNAAGSGVTLRIVGVFAYQRDTAAVAGIRTPVEITRITNAGTGGTTINPGVFDTTDPVLPAQVTARSSPTGGALQNGSVLSGSRLSTEEASIGTGGPGSFPWFQSQVGIYANTGLSSRKRLVLRPGEGIKCKFGRSVLPVGLVACGVTFQTGSQYASELPTYSWQGNTTATANKRIIDIFNAAGSGKVLKITRITMYARPSAAVAGIVVPFEMNRTTSVGTGGTTITSDKYDSADSDVPSQITARDAPTGGAASTGGILIADTLGTDETADNEYRGLFRSSEGQGGNVQYLYDAGTTRRQITIREGEGFVIGSGPLSGVGNVLTIVEGTLE
jgi:hypothetical protein